MLMFSSNGMKCLVSCCFPILCHYEMLGECKHYMWIDRTIFCPECQLHSPTSNKLRLQHDDILGGLRLPKNHSVSVRVSSMQ